MIAEATSFTTENGIKSFFNFTKPTPPIKIYNEIWTLPIEIEMIGQIDAALNYYTEVALSHKQLLQVASNDYQRSLYALKNSIEAGRVTQEKPLTCTYYICNNMPRDVQAYCLEAYYYLDEILIRRIEVRDLLAIKHADYCIY